MSVTVNAVRESAEAVSLTILSCEPAQQKIAVRFGGSHGGWRWIDVPTNTPVILERMRPEAGAESSEGPTSNGAAMEGCEEYELAVTPSPPVDGRDESVCSLVGVDTRQVVQKPVLLSGADEGGRVFELLLKWTLLDATPTPRESTPDKAPEDHSGTETETRNEEEVIVDTANKDDEKGEEAPPPPPIVAQPDESKEKEISENPSGHDSPKDKRVERHVNPVKELEEPKQQEAEREPQQEQAPQPRCNQSEWKWKSSVVPTLPADVSAARHVLIATIVSVQQPAVLPNRHVVVKLGIEAPNERMSLLPLLRTRAVTQYDAVKVAQMGPPVLFPLSENVSVYCAVADKRADHPSDSGGIGRRVYRRGRPAPTKSPGRSLARIPKAELDKHAAEKASKPHTATSGECTFSLPQRIEGTGNSDNAGGGRNGGASVFHWEKHSHMEHAYIAHGTVQCGNNEVELAFLRMTVGAYRDACRGHGAARRNGFGTVEVRVEDIELNETTEKQRPEHDNTLVEVWLTQPEVDAVSGTHSDRTGAAAAASTSTKNSSGCRHLVLLSSSNCIQPLHFPVSEPFAYLSWAVVPAQQKQGVQENVLHGAAPICLVRPGVWTPITIKLRDRNKSASFIKLWYCFTSDGRSGTDDPSRPYHPASKSTDDGNCYSLRVYLDSCTNLYPLVQLYSRDGNAKAFRLLIMDPEDEVAVSASRPMDLNDMQLYCNYKGGEDRTPPAIKLLFTRVFPSHALYRSSDYTVSNTGEQAGTCSVTFLCRLFAFASVAEAHAMNNAHCIGEGRVVVFPGNVVNGKDGTNLLDIDVHVAIDGMFTPGPVAVKPTAVTSPPPCTVLRMRGEVERAPCGEGDAVICVRSVQLFHRQQQQKRRGRVVWTDGGLSAVYACFWLCRGLSGGGVKEWKEALKGCQVLTLTPKQQRHHHHQQQQEVSLQCNEFVLSTGGEKLVLCAVFIPKTTETVDDEAKVRNTASNLLRKLVRKVNKKKQESESGLRHVQGTMRALNYLEVDLTLSAAAQGAVVGTAHINDELLLQLKAAWVKVPSGLGAATVPRGSATQPVDQPSPHLWALRLTFPTQPARSHVNVHVKSWPVAYDDLSHEQQQTFNSNLVKAHRGGGAATKVDSTMSSAFYIVRPLRLEPAEGEWTLFIFGDACTTRTRLAASVGETVLEHVVVDYLLPQSLSLAKGVIVDCFHGSLHADEAGELKRRAEGEQRWRRKLREDPSIQQPCQLFVPFTSLAISADGSDPVTLRYHTLTRCTDDGALLIGAATSNGKGAIFHYNINENTWSVLPIRAPQDGKDKKRREQGKRDNNGAEDADNSQQASHFSTRCITSRHGHTTVCSSTEKCAYVYGGIGIGGTDPEAATAAVAESNRSDKSAALSPKLGSTSSPKWPVGFMRDVWCINYAEGTATCLCSGENQTVSAPISRWRHAAAFHNDSVIIIGGRTAPALQQEGGKETNEEKLLTEEETQKKQEDGQTFYQSHGGEEEDLLLRRDGLCSCCSLLVFDLNRRAWGTQTTSGATPAPRYGHASAVLGTCVYIFGGMTQRNHLLDDLHELDIATNTWRRVEYNGAVAPPPSHLAAMEAITVSNTPCLVLTVGAAGNGEEREAGDAAERGVDALRLYLFSHASQFWRRLRFNCAPLPAPVGVAMCDATPASMRQHGRRQQPLRHRSLPLNKAVLFRMLVVGGMKAGSPNKGSAYIADYGLERESTIRPVVPTLLNVARDVIAERRQDERREPPHSADLRNINLERSPIRKGIGQRTASSLCTTPRGARSGRKPYKSGPLKIAYRSSSAGPLTQDQQRGLIHRLYYNQCHAQEERKKGELQEQPRSGKMPISGRKYNPHPPMQRKAWGAPAAPRADCMRPRKPATAGPYRNHRHLDSSGDTQIKPQNDSRGEELTATAPPTPVVAAGRRLSDPEN